jgi:hypothetical protein
VAQAVVAWTVFATLGAVTVVSGFATGVILIWTVATGVVITSIDVPLDGDCRKKLHESIDNDCVVS